MNRLALNLILAFLYLSAFPLCAYAESVYQEPTEFISEVFNGQPPVVALLMISGERVRQVSDILGHKPSWIRTRYWAEGERSAWILEEIGKVKPITVGIVVKGGTIEDVRILIYRESHGSEVRRKYFTEQFQGATLNSGMQLSNEIDGIAGATLSVGAVRRLAELALYLDDQRKKELK